MLLKTSQTPRPKYHTAVIVGSVIGGTTFFALLSTAIVFYRKGLRPFFRQPSDPRLELGAESKLEIDGICKLEMDGSSKHEMEAKENAVLEIMGADVCCELPAGNTTPINRRGKDGSEYLIGKSNRNGNGNGNDNAKEDKVDNTAEPVVRVEQVEQVKRCELDASQHTPKDDYEYKHHKKEAE